MFPKLIFSQIFLGMIISHCLFSATQTVSNGEKITDYLQNALPGDTIFIEKGEYFENLIIEKPLTIKGIDYPSIRGGFITNVILIQAKNTIIEGLIVSESGTRLMEDFACIRVDADSVTLRNNIITKPLHGIYIKGGSYITIIGNTIEGRIDLIPEDRGNGIHLWNSNHNLISSNKVSYARDGIYFSFTNHTEVSDNHIHDVRYGLHYMYSDNNIFTNNIFENNVAGAALMYSQKIEFYKNIFARCRGFRAYGILYQSMDESSAQHNLIIDNSRGIFFDNCNSNQFTNNDVVDNDLALQIMGDGENNSIIRNNFINNLGSLVMDIKETSTVWEDKSGGNYWTSYKGYDLDGDGKGDIPHTIQNVFQILESEIPEIRFYLDSPAAEILEIAEQSLPILELGLEKDGKPMMRAIQNKDIPWNRAEILDAGSSPVCAFLFIVFGLFVMVFLYRFNRIL
jgi:nitrous oxidase accessory protein